MGSHDHVPAVEAHADADALRATEREWLPTLVSADLTRARQLHADDFQLINPLGAVLSREEYYLGGIDAGHINYRFWEPEEIVVRQYGEVAVLRYRSSLEIVVQGRHVPRQPYWHTDLYEKRGGQWQVVWSQATETE